MSRLWYDHPAKEWEEALPIGNGRIGAMIYGGTDRERLQVNEESIWLGGPRNRHNPDAKANLPKVRKLLREGRISEAEHLMETALSACPEGMHPYQTLGEIQFFFDGIEGGRERKSGKLKDMVLCEGTKRYERSLDLDTAICRTEFAVEDSVYEREVFTSHPADCLVMRFIARGKGRVNFLAKLRRENWFDGICKTVRNGILLYGNLGRGGYEFAMELRAQAKEGRVYTQGECLKVEDATEVVLYFTADTTWHYTGEEKDRYVERYLDVGMKAGREVPEGLTEELTGMERQEFFRQMALQAFLAERMDRRFQKIMKFSYEELRKEHIADYKSYYDRFAFEVEGAERYEKLPTDQRIERLRKEAEAESSEQPEDVGLTKLLYDYGRYLTIAASREGGLPTTLQGLWNHEFFPPWDSKYTININTEMNYWHVESCNLSECHLPLFELLKKVQKNGRYTAREMYGCRGFVAHHNTDIHGDTAPQDTWYPGTYWVMGAAWLCTHLWMHYRYTGDLKFLKEAFSVMAEAALFFVDYLEEKDGYLVTNPSVSPENTYILPNGEKGCCCIGATMDNQILRDLFRGCLGAWKELGEQVPEECEIPEAGDIKELMAAIREMYDRLPPNRIGSDGRLMEWMEEYREAEPGHRHISHLYGLYPAGEITADGTPELAEACRKTLEYRLAHGGGHTGWSRAWITNHYVSLWDAEAAYDNIRKMLEVSTYPNLFDKHPPFQIDGNFGICAAMNGMLAQSNEERIVLLPALPAAWKTGTVRGMRLVGNLELAMTWQDSRITKAVFQADSDVDTVVKYRDDTKRLQLKKGESKELIFS